MPLRDRNTPPRTTRHSTSSPSMLSTHSTIAPSARNTSSPTRTQRASSGMVVDTRCSSPSIASAVSTKRLSMRSSTSSSTTGPVRSFGPGQVDEHADGAAERRGRGARGRRVLGVHLGRAVRGVEPHDVDTRVEQCLERVGLRRRRADRRHDLRSPHDTSSVFIGCYRPGAAWRPGSVRADGSHSRLGPAGDGRARRAGRGTGARAAVRRRSRAPRRPRAGRRERRARRHRRLRVADRGGEPDRRRRSTTSCSSGSRQRIAEVCRADQRVQGVVVEVRKLEPPVQAEVDHVGVRIERCDDP